MLDIDRIRSNPGELGRMLASRFIDTDDVYSLIRQDALREKLAKESKHKKELRNQMSQTIKAMNQEGASREAVKVIVNDMRSLGMEIATLDMDIAELDDKINNFLSTSPNYPHPSVPVGKGNADNEEVYRRGETNAFPFDAKPYWNIGTALQIIDYDSAAKLNDAQYTVFRAQGAQLKRAVNELFMELQNRFGYREVKLPYTMIGEEKTSAPLASETNKDRMTELTQNRLLSDASILHLYRDTILSNDQLPIRQYAVATGFHANRTKPKAATAEQSQQQFSTIELINICKPEHSYKIFSAISEQSQELIKLLNLPYRVMLKCTGAMAYAAAKTYDIEVWMPGHQQYVRITSFSNCEDYLSRRLSIRYQESENNNADFCHTIYGTGISIGRIVAAILENNQNEDGSVTIPEALIPYMHTDIIR